MMNLKQKLQFGVVWYGQYFFHAYMEGRLLTNKIK
jgi:hypothetical protein